ncbi:MAG: alpha/beta hydrolase [Alphaproteobacteria bacterium]|nr:alpha/beta hydrolase [Alphaproteobacteria bacterium]
MQFIFKDLAVHYTDQGSGHCIIFLHGWGSSQATFSDLIQKLSKNYRCIAFDLPGFGKSETPKDQINWNTNTFAELLKTFFTTLHIEPYAIVGHSFGGAIAITYCANDRTTHIPKKLILIASAGIRKKRISVSLLRIISKSGKIFVGLIPVRSVRNTIQKLWRNALGTDYGLVENMNTVYRNIITEDISHLLCNVSQETLCIWGEKDTAAPLSDGIKISQALLHAHLVAYPDVGHFVHKEKKEEVYKEIQSILNS